MEFVYRNPKALDAFTMTGGAKTPVGVRDAVRQAQEAGLVAVIVVYGWEVVEGEIHEVVRSPDAGVDNSVAAR